MTLFAMALFLLGMLILVFMLARHANLIVENAKVEAEHDLEFLAGLAEEAYLERDYARVENILMEWVKGSTQYCHIKVVAGNGFELLSYTADNKPDDSYEMTRSIVHDDRQLLTINLGRDLSLVREEFVSVRNNFIFLGLSMAFIFGFAAWYALRKLAFTPLENEIIRREQAEQSLRSVNDELETRVEERTAETRKLSSVVQQTDDIVLITDRYGIVEYVNPSFSNISGYSAEEMIGSDLSCIKSGMHAATFYQDLWDTIMAGHSFRDVFINRNKDGNLYYEEKTITPLKDEQGMIRHYVSTGKDISERIEAQERLRYLATHDALTGLPNRMMLKDRLTHALDQAARNNTKVAVMFLDLDRFKNINDSMGHPTGDRLLRIVANKLQYCIRKGDTVGRLGGDEFTVVMEGITDIDSITTITQKVLDSLSEAVIVDGFEIMTTTSIGITVFPDDGVDADTLLKNADVAMYRAKAEGGNTYMYFTQEMSDHAVERMKLQNQLAHALERNEFQLYFQPRIDLRSKQVCGMEALIRWQSPVLGMVAPDKFIPVLEETGMIIDVGTWVFETACEFNQKLYNMGIKPLRVSVNLSTKQFQNRDLVKTIENIKRDYDISNNGLEVEITESHLVDNVDLASEVLNELHDLGVHISIDDFGTGYSSLGYLKTFPIDVLKIDRSFVKDIPEDRDDMAIVQSIKALGDSLGIRIAAEGVENEAQMQYFREYEYDEVQGFYVCRPLPSDEFVAWLLEQNKGLNAPAIAR